MGAMYLQMGWIISTFEQTYTISLLWLDQFRLLFEEGETRAFQWYLLSRKINRNIHSNSLLGSSIGLQQTCIGCDERDNRGKPLAECLESFVVELRHGRLSLDLDLRRTSSLRLKILDWSLEDDVSLPWRWRRSQVGRWASACSFPAALASTTAVPAPALP